MNVKRLVWLVSLVTLVATVLPAFAQSLGEVARKEEERRKHIAAPAKVYTNNDLAAVPESSAVPAPAPSTDAQASAPGASTSPDQDKAKEKEAPAKGPAKDQAYWAGRMMALQAQLDRDSILSDALQTRVNALSADFVNRDDPAQRSVIARNRDKAAAELIQLKQQVIKDRKALADLDEEARRAGVPPGWLR
jgi:hypothetical protein